MNWQERINAAYNRGYFRKSDLNQAERLSTSPAGEVLRSLGLKNFKDFNHAEFPRADFNLFYLNDRFASAIRRSVCMVEAAKRERKYCGSTNEELNGKVQYGKYAMANMLYDLIVYSYKPPADLVNLCKA